MKGIEEIIRDNATAEELANIDPGNKLPCPFCFQTDWSFRLRPGPSSYPYCYHCDFEGPPVEVWQARAEKLAMKHQFESIRSVLRCTAARPLPICDRPWAPIVIHELRRVSWTTHPSPGIPNTSVDECKHCGSRWERRDGIVTYTKRKKRF